MDREYLLEFCWDENKNIINKKKHYLSFETAVHVFTDPNYIDIFDEKHSTMYEERHIIIIGLVQTVILVVCTFNGEFTRIISARYANEQEKRIYYGN